MAKGVPKAINRIREWRLARGWSLEKLGAQCIPPMSKSQVKKREDGDTAVTVHDLGRLADALGVHPADLLPAPPYSGRERTLLEELRELPEADQDAIFRVMEAMTRSERIGRG